MLMFFAFCAISLSAQTQPTKIDEIRLSSGKTITIYSNGTWKERIFSKPKLEFVNIPAGIFTMGSSDKEAYRETDETQRNLKISAFKMSKYEVTFEQYDLFCDATGREKPSDAGWGRGNRPVVNVRWTDAVAFAEWVDCRLPTEAEWEYACRAGTITPYNTGVCLNASQANYEGTSPYTSKCPKGEYKEKTMPVGSFAPNPWGLYDIHGNVWEWCSDWFAPYPPGKVKVPDVDEETNPIGPLTGTYRVLRGGSWLNKAQHCRSAYRLNYSPDYRDFFIGFRLVSLK